MAVTQVASAEHRVFAAGFGGQGVLTLGKLLCLAAMNEGREVTYLPSYGAEVRGGTAHCHVVISPEQIFSPIVEVADSLIILNELSFERFGEMIRPGGLVILNSSLVDPGDYARTHEATVLALPATERAEQMGNVLVANVLLLGAFLAATGLCQDETARHALRQTLTGSKSKSLGVNLKAYDAGTAMAQQILRQD